MKHVNVKPQTACKSYTIFFFFFCWDKHCISLSILNTNQPTRAALPANLPSTFSKSQCLSNFATELFPCRWVPSQ